MVTYVIQKPPPEKPLALGEVDNCECLLSPHRRERRNSVTHSAYPLTAPPSPGRIAAPPAHERGPSKNPLDRAQARGGEIDEGAHQRAQEFRARVDEEQLGRLDLAIGQDAEEASARQLLRRQQHLRRRDAAAGQSRLEQDLRIIGREPRARRDLDARLASDKAQRAGAQRGVGDDEIMRAKILRAGGGAAAREIGGRGDEKAPAEADAPQHEAALRRPAHAKGEIVILMDEIGGAVLEDEIGLDARMRVLELHQDAREMALADAGRPMQAQASRQRAALAAQALERGVERGERPARRLIERAALRRRPHGARIALDEPRAGMGLEIAQQLADRGLRHAEIGRRRGHRAALDDADEGAERGGEVHA
jgi:hypothetical protein